MNLANLKLLVKHFGVGWLAYRATKATTERLGYWKFKLPSRPWDSFRPALPSNIQTAQDYFESKKGAGVEFFFDSDSIAENAQWLSSMDPTPEWPVQTLGRIQKGEFLYFSECWQHLGTEPDWFKNPYLGKSLPKHMHFSQIKEFGYGDVKAVWEASRFAFVFQLARIFARTGADEAPKLFWHHFEHWCRENRPYNGVNWKCGQESSFRFLAALFGLFVFRTCPETTLERVQQFQSFAMATGNRIEKHISYAISQKNNHGISEAVALWTIGVMFPEFPRAEKWKAKGLAVLKLLCDELIYEDGGFSQHSINYHRLVLQLLAWTTRLAKANQIQIDSNITDAFERATNFANELLNRETGHPPRWGNDDGALIFQLSHCDYFDFRPVSVLCSQLTDQDRIFSGGIWDEELFWFGLARPATIETPPDQAKGILSFKQAGLHRLKSNSQFSAFFRATEHFKHRPTQSDQMNVDVFLGRHNLAIDPGTYSYNGEEFWSSIPLINSAAHNSVVVNSKEPETRVSRFLLLPWNACQLVGKRHNENTTAIEFQREIESGTTTVTHHRAVGLIGNELLVIDGLWSSQPQQYSLHWLLDGTIERENSNFEVSLGGSAARLEIYCSAEFCCDMVSGDPNSARGWYSRRYLEKRKANSIKTIATGESLLFVSRFSTSKSKTLDLTLNPSSQPTSLLDSPLLDQLF